MKRFLFYLLALPTICLFAACANDNDKEEVSVILTAANLTDAGYFDGTLYYKVTSNSPYEVSVNKAEENVITVKIPSKVRIDGTDYEVTSIAEEAFRYCRSLTTITIPNSVTSIGE